MKRLTTITILLMCLLFTGGCLEQLALVGGGAAGAMSWEKFITQAQEDVDENTALLEADNERLKVKLASTIDLAEREKLQSRIEENKKWLEGLEVTKLSLAKAKEGLNVDWNNPEAAGIFVLGAIGTFLQWRKQKKLGIALTDVVAGGQEFKRGASEEVLTAFKAAHGSAQSSNTKKIIAVLKAS